ncbi:plasmid segregation protein ParM domain-containing protein [Escherichia coli]
MFRTLPLTEYYDRNNQPNTENIERKKANFRKKITLNGGDTFTIKDVKVTCLNLYQQVMKFYKNWMS